MRRVWPELILIILIADFARAAPQPKAAVLRRILTPAESTLVAAPLLKVATEVKSALGRAGGLRCDPATKPGDGLDLSTGRMQRLFGAQAMPAGSVPRLSATMSCAFPGDGGIEQLIEVRLRVSAHAQDRVNVLPRRDGPILARESGVLILGRADYPVGLTAFVGAFEPASADAGTQELGRPALMIMLGSGAVPFAAAIAAEFNRTDLLVALREIKPVPPWGTLDAEIAVPLSALERAETERTFSSALMTVGAWSMKSGTGCPDGLPRSASKISSSGC